MKRHLYAVPESPSLAEVVDLFAAEVDALDARLDALLAGDAS